jgi:spermidine synthase
MTAKKGDLTVFRQTDAENKSFETNYYNAAIHQAALAQPEFFKRAML